jgi:hypothetical protein
MLALFDWRPAQVFAINLDQVESAKDSGIVMPPGERSRSKAERPRSSTTMASPGSPAFSYRSRYKLIKMSDNRTAKTSAPAIVCCYFAWQFSIRKIKMKSR